MEAERISVIDGRALPMRGDDIDTDRIMPARFLRAVVLEGVLAEAVEGHAAQEARRDDPIGVDVVAAQHAAAARDALDVRSH